MNPRVDYEIVGKQIICYPQKQPSAWSVTLGFASGVPRVIARPERNAGVFGVWLDDMSLWPSLYLGARPVPERKLTRASQGDFSSVAGCSVPMGTEAVMRPLLLLAWLERVLNREQAYSWTNFQLQQLPRFAFFVSESEQLSNKEWTSERLNLIAQRALLFPQPEFVLVHPEHKRVKEVDA
jgi:hypothetical protein